MEIAFSDCFTCFCCCHASFVKRISYVRDGLLFYEKIIRIHTFLQFLYPNSEQIGQKLENTISDRQTFFPQRARPLQLYRVTVDHVFGNSVDPQGTLVYISLCMTQVISTQLINIVYFCA